MLYSGSRAVIGSWKIIAISRPRMPRIQRSLFSSNDSAPKRISPPKVAASSSRRMASAVTDLPEPDSPTRPTFSPTPTLRLMSSMTRLEAKSTHRFLISSSGAGAESIMLALASIEGVAQGIADEGQQQQGHHQHGEGRDTDPPGIQVFLAEAQQLAQGRNRGGHAQSEKIQRREPQNAL